MKKEIIVEEKWEWIARKCTERRYYKAASLANKINDALIELYGKRNTETWIKVFTSYYSLHENIPDSELHLVANMQEYCIACEDTTCSTCLFADECGYCGDHDSLFMAFLYEFERVSRAFPEEEV